MEYIKLFEDYNQGLTLYHGSFYKFDRFDFSKLSKHGSQNTYGVGVYLTDNIDYAKSYISGENGSIGEKGYLYEVVLKPNSNFLFFGESDNTHHKIDPKNLQLINNQLKNENIILKDSKGNPTEITQDDLVWNAFLKIKDHIYYNNFTIKQHFNYGDFYSKKEAGDFLVKCGIDGLKYPMGSKIPSAPDYGYDGYSYVVYHDIFDKIRIIG